MPDKPPITDRPCVNCEQRIPMRGPSDDFCSSWCQTSWHHAQVGETTTSPLLGSASEHLWARVAS